ncbi:MAG: hypothetical protein AAF518_25155 [Spirochaetota bacterium]
MDTEELKQLFYKIRDTSFSDYAPHTKLIIKDLGETVGAISSPFADTIHINLELFRKHKQSKEEFIGLFAHELAHKVSYKKRSLWQRIALLWNYPFSLEKQKCVEQEADQIAIERGYAKELLLERKKQYQRFEKFANRMKQIKACYLTPEEIEATLEKQEDSF